MSEIAIEGVSVKVPKDEKPGMPFSMIEGMMPMFPMIAIMGRM